MPPKKKAANGYKFAEPLPKSIILEDIGKKKWRLGPSIGKGGFGEIYSAQEENTKGTTYPYVIKIEPHANGPLFVEINFYIRHARAAEIEDFKKKKGLKTFGMPVYYGSGSLEYKGEKYRFLVMDKFSTDLYKLYIDNNKVFPVDTVFKLGIQILDILEYIHERGYVHADIKAANILLGATKETQNKQAYLVDFGLATKYTTEKEFKPNPKKAHDGTIEFLSRDAHQGVQTRRGDLEILAYNLIQWLGCKLPWEGNLSDPKVVHNQKEEHMATVPKMIKASFTSKTPPKAIVDFLKYIKTLKFNTEPDYKKIRDIFISGVKEGGGVIGTPLLFSVPKTPLKRNRTPLSSANKKTKLDKIEESEVSDDEDETPKPKKRGRTKKPIVSNDDNVVEMATANSDEEPNISFVTKRNPRNKRTNVKIIRQKSRSLQDLSSEINFDTDAMKEIKLRTVKTDVPIKKNRTQPYTKTNKYTKLSTTEENGETSSDVEEIPKLKTRGRLKKDVAITSEENDIEMVSLENGDDELNKAVTSKKKLKNDFTKGKKGLNRKKSRSLTDLRSSTDLEGYTDAMKEIVLKKQKAGGRKNRVNSAQKTQSSTYQNDDDMAGFTEEMKAIALKKNAKEKTVKRKSPTVPIATTSKASNKRGLVQPNSQRLLRKPQITRGKVLRYSEGSVSD